MLAALVLWELRLLLALLFIAMTVASAMRPGVEALARRRIPRSVGIAIHYLVFLALVAVFLFLVRGSWT